MSHLSVRSANLKSCRNGTRAPASAAGFASPPSCTSSSARASSAAYPACAAPFGAFHTGSPDPLVGDDISTATPFPPTPLTACWDMSGTE